MTRVILSTRRSMPACPVQGPALSAPGFVSVEWSPASIPAPCCASGAPSAPSHSFALAANPGAMVGLRRTLVRSWTGRSGFGAGADWCETLNHSPYFNVKSGKYA